MALPTAEEIINYYLYGQSTKPSDIETDAIIRPQGASIIIDLSMQDVMAGPGRFAIGPIFTLVTQFFSSAGANLPPGTYTKAQLADIFGLSFFGEILRQRELDDRNSIIGSNDYADRTFIFNTTAWQLIDDVRFIVEPGGSRFIENYGVEPSEQNGALGDFDFESSDFLAGAFGEYLEYRTDISQIGRTVDFNIIGSVTPRAEPYTIETYFFELELRSQWEVLPERRLFSETGDLLQDLFDSGATKFLDVDDRVIIYGTAGGDDLEGLITPAQGAPSDEGRLHTHPYYRDFYTNGVRYITGNGDDQVAGTGFDDVIELGAGADTADGSGGEDEIRGGEGSDVLKGGRDDDLVSGDLGNDVVESGQGNDTLYGHNENEENDDDAGQDTLRGGEGNDTLYGGKGGDELDGGAGDDQLYHNAQDTDVDDNAADMLQGGDGNDRYFAGDGDTINDSDGNGSIEFKGIKLTGGKAEPENGDDCEEGGNDHESDDEKTYEGSHGETYRKSGDGLTVEYDGATLTIENWSDGDLGITLEDEGPQDGGPCDDDHSPDDYASPLVLDLDGDGLELIALEDSTAFFDIDRDGVRERTGWVGPDDGLLALDRNLNGSIDGADELFGYGITFSGAGQAGDPGDFVGPSDLDIQFESGFAQLAELDINLDRVIDANDAEFDNLRVWRDVNGDGVSQEGELISLTEAGVVSIFLDAAPAGIVNAGNLITDVANFTTVGGASCEISDVWFRFNQYDTRFGAPDGLDPALEALPDLRGNGDVKPLRLAVAENPALRALVEQLNGLTPAELGKASPLIDHIMYEWAGVAEAGRATGRGPYADQRSVAVMEAFADTPFAQWSGPSPRPMAGGVLSDQYNAATLGFAARLIAQTELGQALLPELTFENNQFLILQAGVDSSTALQRLAATAPADVNAALAHYQAGARLLDTIYLSFADVKAAADDGAAYKAAVEALIQSAGISLNYASLITARIGGDGDDSILTESFNSSIFADKTPVVSGGQGDDEIVLGGNRQIVFWGAGQGSDTIDLDPFSSQGWTILPRVELRLPGVLRADVSYARSGDALSSDLMMRIDSTGETLTIRNLFAGTTNPSGVIVFDDGETVPLANEFAAFTEMGTSGDDVLIQLSESATLNGGAGNDLLRGASGATTYAFDAGDGRDEIVDDREGENVVTFGPGVNSADLRFAREGGVGGNLIITYTAAGDEITIRGQFNEVAPVVSYFVFDDGSELFAEEIAYFFMEDGSGDDTVLGTAGGDEFFGNSGNDLIRGYGGSDVYYLAPGNGQDIVDDGGPGGVDTLRLFYDFADLTVSGGSGEFVFLHEPSGDQVTARGIEIFDFSDMTGLSVSDIEALIEIGGVENAVTGTTGPDVLNGTEDNDLIAGLSGDDTIEGFDGNDQLLGGDGADQLFGGDGRDVLEGGQGADVLEGGAGDDVLVAGDAGETPSSLQANNTLRGGDGNDTLDGGWRNDTLEGGAGNDVMRGDFGTDVYRGGAGDDVMIDRDGASTYHYEIGDGHDLIFDDGSSTNTDAIEFGAGITAADLSFSFVRVNGAPYTDYFAFDQEQWAIRADLAQGGSVTFAGNQSDPVGQIDRLRFSDGSSLSMSAIEAIIRAPTDADQVLVGRTSSSNDTLEGGGGNDTLYGNFGNMTFLFDAGDGQDVIVAPGAATSVSTTIRFGAGVAPGDITISRSGEFDDDLVISLESGDSITVIGQYATEPNRNSPDGVNRASYIDRIVFDSDAGTTLDAAALRAATLISTVGNDVLIGSNFNDTLPASAGDDEARGGRGSDQYHFGIGSGADVIVESERGLTYVSPYEDGGSGDVDLFREADTLTFGADVTIDDLRLTATGEALTDLLIEIEGTADSLLIRDQLAATGNWGWILGDPFDRDAPHYLTEEEWNDNFASDYGEEHLFRAGVERFVFFDGTELTWAELADLVTSRDDDGDNLISTDDEGGVLDGGAGTDRLEGGAGDDTYVLNIGSFNDTASDSGGYDEVAFGADISPELIAFSRVGENGDDLLIEIGGTTRNSLLIQGQFAGDGRTLELFRTEDGAEFTAEQVEKLLLSQSITSGSDIIVGYEGADIISARGGDDVIEARGGDDLIDGGDGRDTAVFRGPRSNYDVVQDGDWLIVADQVGEEGVNRLRNVEELRFLGDDEGGGAATEIIVPNETPTAGPVQFAGREDTTLTLRASAFLAAAVDPDGGALTLVEVAAGVGGSVEIDDAGRVVFRPEANFTGEATFTYTVEDAGGLRATAAVIVDVAPVNDAPVIASPLPDVEFNEDTAVSFQIAGDAFEDIDGDGLALGALLVGGNPLPSWLSFDPELRSFTGTPHENFNGVLEIEVTAADAEYAVSDVFSLTIAPVNDAPVVSQPLDDLEVGAGELFELVIPQGTFTDVDGDVLIYSATLADGSPLPEWLLFSEEVGAFAGLAPVGTNGDFSVRVTASDGIAVAEDEFVLSVLGNLPPTDIALSNQSINENSAGGAVVGELSAVDPDADETFAFSVVTPDSPFEVVGDQLVVKDGVIIDFEAQPSIDVTIEVRDGADNAYQESFTIGVNDVNEAPTDIVISNASVDENAAGGTVVGDLSALDPDVGETFTYAILPTTRPLDQALIENARAPIAIAYTGSDGGFPGTGLSLASAGRVYDSEGDAAYSVWRVRNSAEVEQTVTLAGVLGGYQETFTVAANTDTYILSPFADGLATHALFRGLLPVGLSLIASTAEFDNDTPVEIANTSFEISGSQLVVADGASLDHELTTSQTIAIEVTDSAGHTYDEEVTIGINDVDGAAAATALNFSMAPEEARAESRELAWRDVETPLWFKHRGGIEFRSVLEELQALRGEESAEARPSDAFVAAGTALQSSDGGASKAGVIWEKFAAAEAFDFRLDRFDGAFAANKPPFELSLDAGTNAAHPAGEADAPDADFDFPEFGAMVDDSAERRFKHFQHDFAEFA